ncbi:unnamed protein product [Thlaspi arvense]|uniref:Uncharacterized protein n=1 Tax=Thlaspi arvense TaxID=13288 RepID=A0AAU9RVR8_THLAR|nr:unnamed protein product [Thlaspi arvense]
MRIFLGSNLLKNGVSWSGFKGSLIFALGFYTNKALNPSVNTILKEARESLDEAKSLGAECIAHLDKLRETRKTMNHLKQLYDARTDELEELQRGNGVF